MKYHKLVVLAAFSLLTASAGCGGDSRICKIIGTLKYKGEPMPQVYVRFEPDDLATKSTSMAVTDADGKFEMYIGSTPGVFKGQVTVYCDDPLAAIGGKSAIPEKVEPAYRALCEKYGHGKSTYELTIDKPNSNLQLNLE